MINNLSIKLTNKLISKGSITENKRELYIYGFFMLISHLMYLVLTIILGLIFKCFLESVIFYIAFQFIRRYAGGFHAKTEATCEILSSLSIFCCIGVIRISKICDIKIALLCLSLLFAISIFIFCPLDTPEKPLTDKEHKHFRKISLMILLCILIAIILSYKFKTEYIFVPCCMSLILEGILINTAKMQKYANK